MYFKILLMAWRNLWRNTRRTLITALAIGLGLGAIIFTMTWMEGMVVHLIQTMTGTSLGQAQIHATGYRETRDDELVLRQADDRLKEIDQTPRLVGAAPRLYAQGLAAMGDRSAGVEVMGVDFERERKVTDWTEKVSAGKYPAVDREVLIGRGLARKLELEAGDKLVITVARVGTGDLEGAMVRIAGVIGTGVPMLDDHTVMATLALTRKLTGLSGSVHQIALKFDDPNLEQEELESLLEPLKRSGSDVQPWHVLAPMLAGFLDLQGLYVAISFAIIFGLVAFGIVNTMSMSLLERFKEFGVLRAIGTPPLRLFCLILAEAASLGIVGGVIGTGLGIAATRIFQAIGLDIGQVEITGVSIDSAIYPILDIEAAALVVAVFLIMIPLVAIGPAIKAARIVPVRALRSE